MKYLCYHSTQFLLPELSAATFSLFTVSVTSTLSLDVAFDKFEAEVDLLLFTVDFVVLEFPFFILEEP